MRPEMTLKRRKYHGRALNLKVEQWFSPSRLNEGVRREVLFERVNLADLEEDDSDEDSHLHTKQHTCLPMKNCTSRVLHW